MSENRRDRSRSPMRFDTMAHRRNGRNQNKPSESMTLTSPMIMSNMYQQGNMMVASGIYPNMMMPGALMQMTSPGMDIIQSSGMEVMAPPSMDMSAIAATNPNIHQGMDMSNVNMVGGMMVDPTMMGMYSNLSSDISIVQEKKEIVLKHVKLTPSDPGTPMPPQRVKPPGCRTIFVGGLPDKIRESHLREIFEVYGRIHTLRLSKKNFCHIRFDRESSVDVAMLLSGYRITLINNNKDEMDDMGSKDTTGYLHVDYAFSRDDQNEYERRQRQVLRAQQQQMEQLNAQHNITSDPINQRERSPSPMRVTPFSNAAIVQVAEKVKSDESFITILPTLIAWLERGECSKKNSNQFYTMIQATNSHIRRLFNEKMSAEEELQECKERVKNKIGKIIDLLEQVAKVFTAATHQRVWDHFTKPQRKNIETWQKMTQEFSAMKEEFNEKFLNDDDYNGFSLGSNKTLENNEEIQQLKRENESLQFQLEAYKNEVDVIKSDAFKEMEKFKAQFIARQALEGNFKNQAAEKPPPPLSLPEESNQKLNVKESVDAGCGEAKLIGIISAFLQVHPKGASLDYVVSYVRALFPKVSQASVHHVLQKHADVFQLKTNGVGANIENKWYFSGFADDGM